MPNEWSLLMRRSLSLALATCAGFLSLSPVLAAEPFGKWVRPSTGAQVNFYDCAGKLCGKIVAVKSASSAREVGIVIVKGAVKTGDNEWKGNLLDATSGKTYAGVITLVGADGLNIKGCALGIICEGETWRRLR
jgi:uncharacterized protein (DUF2147 family)